MNQAQATVASSELGLIERRAFMKLPIEERRRQLAVQAAQLVSHYEERTEASDREAWQGGEIVECS